MKYITLENISIQDLSNLFRNLIKEKVGYKTTYHDSKYSYHVEVWEKITIHFDTKEIAMEMKMKMKYL